MLIVQSTNENEDPNNSHYISFLVLLVRKVIDNPFYQYNCLKTYEYPYSGISLNSGVQKTFYSIGTFRAIIYDLELKPVIN